MVCLAEGGRAVEDASDPVEIATNKALVQPDALRDLSNIPLETTFEPLQGLVYIGRVTGDDHERARGAGHEEKWLQNEVAIGKDSPLAVERAGQVALEVLLSHPDLEKFVSAKMDNLKKRIAERDSYKSSDAVGDMSVEYRYLIYFTESLPANMSMRLLGAALFSPHFAPRQYSDYSEYSPASYAVGGLQRVAKTRLGENVPSDVEQARSWWKQNESRFAMEGAKMQDASASAAGPMIAPSSEAKLDHAILTRGAASHISGIGILTAVALLLFVYRGAIWWWSRRKR